MKPMYEQTVTESEPSNLVFEIKKAEDDGKWYAIFISGYHADKAHGYLFPSDCSIDCFDGPWNAIQLTGE
jgi:hypothetical protein